MNVNVEVGILGAFECLVDGRVCVIRGAAERELLARLALAPGSVVSADRLIDDLWGERLPVDAANALQARVAKLRRALVGAGVDLTVVATQAPGYVLHVPLEAVDAQRFTRLLSDARRLAERQRLAAAAGTYRKALDLWRGAALGEFTSTWAATEASRLEELRLVAVEERTDVELALGRHGELVADLEPLIAANPLRERLRGQLMLALYRSGRQGDALAVYADARQALAEDLGIDPSDDLQRLEAAVLRQDPALRAPPQQMTAARRPLPQRRTSFLGRTGEMDQVPRLLVKHRLVTLTGPGGAGKTALAVEAARSVEEEFTDGAAFVPLSAIGDGRLVAHAVAHALDIPLDAASGTVERVVSALRSRHALLILDNCEHLADAVAQFAERALTACPDIRLLATSREPLGIAGEAQLPVPPLPVPDPDADTYAVAANPAVQLFVDRAQAVDASFVLDGDNRDDVVRICAALDGIPLAIELAAARVKMLPPRTIGERLDDRFGLLSHGPRTAEVRQRTLRATVEWGHDLLTNEERRLFRRLSVFRGGWTLEAAEDVCSGDGIDRREVLDVLTRLVDRSMVVADTLTSRFRMLETLRHYALERLVEGDEEARVRAAHVRFFLDLAERAEAQLRGPDQRLWLERMHTERHNLHQALTECLVRRDDLGEQGLRLVGALGWYWYVGRQIDGRAYVTAMLDAAQSGGEEPRARALQALSLALRPVGCLVHPSPAAAIAAADSAALFEYAGDAERAAISHLLVAVEGVSNEQPDEALATVSMARGVLAQHSDRWGCALADFVEMEIRLHHGEVDTALALGEQSWRNFDGIGDAWGRSAVLLHLGLGLRASGRLKEAESALERAAVLSRDGGLPNNLAGAFGGLGDAALHRGDADAAERWFAQCRAVAVALGNDTWLSVAALGDGAVARLRQDSAKAQGCYGDALRLAANDFVRGSLRARIGLASARLDVGPPVPGIGDELEHVLREARSVNDAALIASALEQLARTAAAQGRPDAVALLREADAVRIASGTPRGFLEQRDLAAVTGGAVS